MFQNCRLDLTESIHEFLYEKDLIMYVVCFVFVFVIGVVYASFLS